MVLKWNSHEASTFPEFVDWIEVGTEPQRSPWAWFGSGSCSEALKWRERQLLMRRRNGEEAEEPSGSWDAVSQSCGRDAESAQRRLFLFVPRCASVSVHPNRNSVDDFSLTVCRIYSDKRHKQEWKNLWLQGEKTHNIQQKTNMTAE